MMPTTYIRRIDDQPVEALQYTGNNLGEVRALVGAGYRVAVTDAGGLTLTQEHPEEREEAAAWDWIIRDGQRVYAVRSFAFRGHCRGVPVE